MAMTKKERAEFDAALKEARLLAALRWSEQVRPDVPPPKSGEAQTSGWVTRPHSGDAVRGISSCISHATAAYAGGPEPARTTSQNPIWLYSTEVQALRAVRYAVARRAAAELLAIDERIAKALEASGQ